MKRRRKKLLAWPSWMTSLKMTTVIRRNSSSSKSVLRPCANASFRKSLKWERSSRRPSRRWLERNGLEKNLAWCSPVLPPLRNASSAKIVRLIQLWKKNLTNRPWSKRIARRSSMSSTISDSSKISMNRQIIRNLGIRKTTTTKNVTKEEACM